MGGIAGSIAGAVAGKVVGKALGGEKKSKVRTAAPRIVPPSPFTFRGTTGGFNFNPDNTTLSITGSPGFNEARDFLGQQRDALGRLSSGIGGDIAELRGNRNPFITARVSPLQEQAAQARGALQRNLARRNVFGSLSQNLLSDFDRDVNRQLSDARALATQDSLGALRQAQALQGQTIGNVANLENARLQVALSELGLGNSLINAILSDRRVVGGGSTTTTPDNTGQRLFGNILAAGGGSSGGFTNPLDIDFF